MIKIYPGITTVPEEFEQMLKKLQPTGETLQVDFADGVFVPSTLGNIEGVANHPEVTFQIHLMVEKPENYLERLINLPNVESIIFHIESASQPMAIIDAIHQGGKKVGISLNPETNIEALEPVVSHVDFVQFMTVYPGGYGAEFQSSVLGKVEHFHALNPEMPIEIDGGMNPSTVSLAVKAGATMIESGSYVANSDDPKKAIEELRESVMRTSPLTQ